MSHKHRPEIVSDDELPVIALDHKRRIIDGANKAGKGWKFYIKIQDSLPDWWYKFNNVLNDNEYRKNKPKYRTIKSLAEAKFKDKQERNWFLLMTGKKKVWEREAISTRGKSHEVPWLGDWEARRRNGYWETENKEYIKSLRQAMKDNVSSGQAIRATSPFHVKSLMRWERLADKIDDLFEGKPFVDENPGSKNNLSRFKLYTSMHEKVEELKVKTIKEWMRIHGVDPNNPHEMADMAVMAQMVGSSAAAGALTGFSAAASMQPLAGQDGRPSGEQVLSLNGQGVVISPDALLLAQHLVKHSTVFKKPLPAIEIQGEVVEEVKSNGKEKSNGHAKAN